MLLLLNSKTEGKLMDNDKIWDKWDKTAHTMAGSMIGNCVISLITNGVPLSVDTLRTELERQAEPDNKLTRPIVDAALAIIDQAH